MNPLPPGMVPYESRFPRWLDDLTTQLDYFWFVALLAWTLTLVLWRWHPRRKEFAASPWAWLPWSAAAGVLAAVIEFYLVNVDVNIPSRRWCNVLLGALPLLAAAGWCWQLLAQRSRWLQLIAILSVLPFGTIAALRYYNPALLGWWMVGATLLAAVPWVARRGGTAWSRLALLLVAFIPLLSNVGPLALRWRLFGNGSVPQNAGALAAGAFQALAGLVVLTGLARDAWRALAPGARREVWRDARPFIIGGGLWTVACLAFGIVAAQQQLDAGVRFSLEQVHRVAMQFNPRQLAAALGPEFQLDVGSLPLAESVSPLRFARSTHLATGVGAPIARVLADVTGATRGGLASVSIVTLRDGWLVVALSSRRFEAPGQVRLARRATEEDMERWNAHAEYAELAVADFGSGGVDFLRLPLESEDRAMLGWLEFAQFRGGNAPMRARTAPFVGTVLGLVVAALFFAQRRSLQAREAALREAAIAAETTRLKTDFLAQVSHELRTPLQSILGYGELLAADVPGETGRARLAALRQNGELMLRLVNDLLDLSAVEAGAFRLIEKPTALAALVRETVESLRPRAEAKGLALSCDLAPEFPAWLATDGERFRQIVINLVGNAVKFTERGRVDVTLRVVDLSGPGCLVELAVRDTGPGIAPEDHVRLFQPFSRLDLTAKKEGTGLGLALSAALCRNQGGGLTVESDGRTGACFRARLKLRPVAPPPANVRATNAFPTLRGRRVLIVDDNALVRDLFAAWLADFGAVCEVAGDGAQALALAAAQPFDAVILDLAMPRLDGLAAARQLRALGRDWRIVGVSAHASGGDRAQALAAGMDVFLSKPVELHALAAALVAGPAPKISAEKRERLRAQLAVRFRDEVAGNAAAIRAALTQRDWPALHARTHYLKSSAGVVGDENLYAACEGLENTADAKEASGADVAWSKCEAALAPWLK